MWKKIKKTLSKMFRYKPRKHFYFVDHKNNCWISVYNTNNEIMEFRNRRYSEYVDAIASAWEHTFTNRFNSALKRAVCIYKKHRHDMFNDKKRFVLKIEHFEER